MGGKSSSSTSANTTNQYDQRQVVSNDSHATSNSTTINNADAATINAQNAALLRGLSADATDGVRAVAAMQESGLHDIGGVFTDVSTVAANNAASAWTHTIDASQELLGKVVQASSQTSDSARMVAQAAIASFQPSDNKTADTFKYAAIAGAVIVAFALMRKA